MKLMLLWKIHSYHQTYVQNGIQKNNIQHSNQNSLFTFEEAQLDAESSLENIRDTNKCFFYVDSESGIKMG